MKKFSIILIALMTCMSLNAQSFETINNKQSSKKASFFWDKQQCFSIGATFGCIHKGDKSYTYYGLDVVIAGGFISMIHADTSDREEYSLKTAFQFGYFIPICKFGKKETGIHDKGWDYALLVSPLIEISDVLHIEGHRKHHIDGHNCSWWVDTSYITSEEMGYGVAIMYRFPYANIIGKFTTTSIGLTLSVGI